MPSEITPLKVRIINDGNRAVRIAYKEFTLASSSGFTYRALPPYQITGSTQEPVAAPDFAYSGFLIAPFYRPSIPAFLCGVRTRLTIAVSTYAVGGPLTGAAHAGRWVHPTLR